MQIKGIKEYLCFNVGMPGKWIVFFSKLLNHRKMNLKNTVFYFGVFFKEDSNKLPFHMFLK